MVHIIELMGRIKLVIGKEEGKEDGNIEVVYAEGNPYIGPDACSIWQRRDPKLTINRDCAIRNVKRLIKDYGMFTEERKFDRHKKQQEPFVKYGTTEIMMTALTNKSIDAVVTVCDGAGTVITKNPDLVEGIGAEMPGLLYTERIKETINEIKRLGGFVLDENRAIIDQVEGVRKAYELKDKLGVHNRGRSIPFLGKGKMKIAVSVVKPSDAKRLREMENEYNIDLILMGVHHTGLENDEKKVLYETLDLMPNCGKTTISENEEKIKYKVGNNIPMFALRDNGVKLLKERVDAVKRATK